MAKKAIRIDISAKAICYKADLEAMACETGFKENETLAEYVQDNA